MSKRNRHQSAAPAASNGQGVDPGSATGPAQGSERGEGRGESGQSAAARTSNLTPRTSPRANAAPAAAAANTNNNSSEVDLTDLLMSAVEIPPTPTASPGRNNETRPSNEREHEAPADEAGAPDDTTENPPGDAGEEGEEAATQEEDENEPVAAAEGEEDLGELAAMDDEELDALGQSRQWPASYLKRVKKFTRAQRSLEAENRRLREEAEEGVEGREARDENQSPRLAPHTSHLAPSAREGDLAAQIAQHEEWLDRIEAVAPGESLVHGEQTFGPEQLRKARRKLETQLSALTYERSTEQRRRDELVQEGETEAMTRHPWLKDRSNAETVAINRAFNEYPVLKAVPYLRSLIADALTLRKLQAKVKAGKEGGEVRGANGNATRTNTTTNGSHLAPQTSHLRPAARPPGRPAAAPMPARRGPDTAAGVKKALDSGRMEDAVAVIGELVDIR